jgi:FkbM family methyltransferase
MRRYADDSRLIFDLGMNNGDDAAFYLSRGFEVVALEANAALCELARKRFHGEIDDGRLKIVNAAIWETSGETTFYINLDNDHWSSIDVGWAGRDDSRCKAVRVRCVTLADLFDEFDVPHFLKIDVEGVDHLVLDQLRGRDRLPQYVSVEDCRFGFQYMETLSACGFDGFKLLDQSTVPTMTDPATGRAFPVGSSGPFGADLPGEWLSYADIVQSYSKTVRDLDGNRIAPRTRWWDIHCTRLAKTEADQIDV